MSPEFEKLKNFAVFVNELIFMCNQFQVCMDDADSDYQDWVGRFVSEFAAGRGFLGEYIELIFKQSWPEFYSRAADDFIAANPGVNTDPDSELFRIIEASAQEPEPIDHYPGIDYGNPGEKTWHNFLKFPGVRNFHVGLQLFEGGGDSTHV